MKRVAIFLAALMAISVASYAADDEINLSFPENADAEYVVLCKYDFSQDTETDDITSVTKDDNHFAAVDTGKEFGVLKNSDGSGKCELKINFPKTYGRAATRIGVTYYVSPEHQRTKVYYYNSNGEIVHQNNMMLRADGLVVGDNDASQANSKLPKTTAETPMRLEVQFDFENSQVDYRLAALSEGKWSFCEWVTDNTMYVASGDIVKNLAGIGFSNEYSKCDMYVDDVKVSATKTKPEAKTVRITGMKEETLMSNDVLEGDYDYYDENGILENKEETSISWIVSDDENFTTESIAGTDKTIALNESHAGKYIKLRVIPVSTAGITADKHYESETLGPIVLFVRGNNPPVAKQLSITGELITCTSISAAYEFEDEDHDEEVPSATQIEWYLVTPDGESLIKTSTKEDLSLEIKDEYMGNKIKVSVIPVSDNEEEEAGSKVSFLSDVIQPNKAYLDHAALTLSPESGSSISSNLYLPQSGSNGSVITWSSSNSDVLASDGSIKRKSTDVTIQLTATVDYSGITYTKNFEYTVLKVEENSGGGGSGGGRNSYSYSAVTKNEDNKNEKNEIAEENKTDNIETEKNPSVPFSDLEGYSWAEEAIRGLHNNGVINGDENGKFNPSKSITRAEFIKMIVSMFKVEGTSDISFKDVSANDWFYEYVNKAVATGIIKGDGADRFRPESPITREEMAVILHRVMGFKQPSSSKAFDDDGDISHYARAAVYSLRDKGIISGKGENQFDPKGLVTRAEGAKLLWSAGK